MKSILWLAFYIGLFCLCAPLAAVVFFAHWGFNCAYAQADGTIRAQEQAAALRRQVQDLQARARRQAEDY